MNFLSKLIAPFQKALRQSVSSFIQLETAEGTHTLVGSDGSLVSYIRLDGSKQLIGQEEFDAIIEGATIKLGSRFDRQGHSLQVYFSRDPNRIRAELQKHVRPSQVSAQNIGLDINDLFEDRVDHLQKFLTHEEAYFVLWTRPPVLTKTESKRAVIEAKEKAKDWPPAQQSQYPFQALDALRARHKSYITSVLSALNEIGMTAELLENHDALSAIRSNLFPDKANEDWRACLPGDKIPPRAPLDKIDLSDILWPSLANQITASDAKILGQSVVRIGDLLWAGADMTLGPQDELGFPYLLNRLVEADIPFRISFMIEGGGVYSTQMRQFLATIFGVTNSKNKQVKYSIEGLNRLARDEAVIRLRVSFATWCRVQEKGKILDQLSTLLQAVESWGYCQVSEFSGDPLDCIMSSAMGIHAAGTAPTAIAPLRNILKLLPWQRPSSPFHEGSLLLRTPDGKIWPYQTGTNLTTTWFDLIFAQPGAGKSVLLNSLNLSTCLGAGLQKLPYVAVIDIGPSSSGLISMIKEALPLEQQHEAAYYRLQMSYQFAINPFDTQLGCRYPLPDERSYLVELMTLLCTPPGYEKPYDGMQQLCGMVVDEMFRWRDDKSANAEPRPYLPRVEEDIDEAIQRHNIHLPADPYWWDIVDKLFEVGQPHLAMIAQRHASPTLNDSITASRRPQIRTLLEETAIGVSSENVINAFERMITSAIREFPILSSVTQFDIGSTKICALDLMDVAPQGDEAADRQTSIMYMLARHALVRNWWLGKESLDHMPQKFRDYHAYRLQEMAESPKRLCYDEFHRTSSSGAVRAQVIRDVREGRKRGVQIVLASQLLDDFDDDMVDLATGVWVLGTAISDQAVDDIKNRFGLTNSAREVIRNKLTGPKAAGGPMLFVLGTNEGRYEQYLFNTLGPIELWALSTSVEDVAIRNRLYDRLGASLARKVLAAKYPNGSARSEIRQRILAKADSDSKKSALISAVIDEIVEELVKVADDLKNQEAAKRMKVMGDD